MKYSNKKDVSAKKGSFRSPEQLPNNPEEKQEWQDANKKFWEEYSMRYDWNKQIPFREFSREFYQEIDRRFLSAVKDIMPWKKIPFEKWIDFEGLKGKDVLEIGVGNGTHAQLILPYAKSYTGIDLTEYGQKSTSRRLEISQLEGKIMRMDAEHLEFTDESFDFVWSWGVIHHSSNTAGILDEIQRVLRPNGKTVIMVYYRSIWSYYVAGILLGISKGLFFRGESIHEINQARTDGALARYYTLHSWKELVTPKFTINRLETLGNKGDILPIPGGGLKSFILRMISPKLTVYFLKQLRMGSMLICEMTKK